MEVVSQNDAFTPPDPPAFNPPDQERQKLNLHHQPTEETHPNNSRIDQCSLH
jgi:hypothetical protein